MRTAPLPATRAASTNSRVHSDSAAPRTRRANTGTLKMPMAMIALSAPGPNTAVIMIAIKQRREGEHQVVGAHDRLVDEAAAAGGGGSPSGTPSPSPMPTATSATAIEVRAPTISIDRMSRPKWSVPSQCTAEGGCSLSAMASRVTSYGVQAKLVSAATTTTPTSSAPGTSERSLIAATRLSERGIR